MSFDEGQSWSAPNENGNLRSTWIKLCNYVEVARGDCIEGFYLDAVTKALHLYKDLNQIGGSRKAGEDIDTKLRDLIYRDIVRPLELEVEPEVRKRRGPAAAEKMSNIEKFSNSDYPGRQLGIQQDGTHCGEDLDTNDESC
ncbi:hypothetical protein TWF106_000135 [Orbilia oligospora]|uniref:DUF7580 domain-containing protein n=1 Tax=Orbilia oligospora TaxID=2813651 RepID=A0A7C8V753_ORBOL|nr:hypothetical protein TWF106_000100 [Orbilia oligospora]KAF3229747.1 hypothetical protein TWF106_000135 [Orbilia oligospora]